MASLTLWQWWSKTRPSESRSKTSRPRRTILTVEPLEGRAQPALFTVTTLVDAADPGDGVTSLREAISSANASPGDDTIDFAVTGAIDLTSSLPALSGNLTLDGPGPDQLTLRRSQAAGTPEFGILTVDDYANVTLAGLTIAGGRAESGAGVLNKGGLAVRDCAFTGNSAAGAGGAIYSLFSNLTMARSTLAANSAADFGGAIFAIGGNVSLTQCTLSGNSAYSGAGLSQISADTLLINCTITNNRLKATAGRFGPGGGIDSFLGTLALQNTLVAGNFRGAGSQADDVNGDLQPASAFNLIGDGAGLTGITDGVNGNQVGSAEHPIDPRLAPLADNGGGALTHALLTGSPALDRGSNDLATDLDTDQRGAGFVRRARAAGSGANATVDVGAVEASVSLEDIADKSTREDTPLPAFSFLVGDSTLGTIAVTAVSSNTALAPAANLVISGVGGSRTLTITPAADQFGQTTITVTASRTIGSKSVSMSDTFVLTVAEVNDAPIGGDDTLGEVAAAAATQDFTLATLLANDAAGPANESGQRLTIVDAGSAVGGTVKLIDDRVFFLPTGGYLGPAGFEYTLKDDGATSGSPDPRTNTAKVSFTITAGDNLPTAANDALADIAEDSAARIISVAVLLANDGPAGTGAVGDVIAVGAAVGGAVSLADNNVVFLPAADYNGPASFVYVLQSLDGRGEPQISDATVRFNIVPVNDAPLNLLPTFLRTKMNKPLVLARAGRLAVADVDARSARANRSVYRVTLTVRKGVLALSSTRGLTSISGNGKSKVVVTGALTAINDALAGLRYKPARGFRGKARLTVVTEDFGSGLDLPTSAVGAVLIRVR